MVGRGKRGSMISEPPFEVLIGLVAFFLLVGFFIAQSGGIQSVLDMVCEKLPDICGGSYSTIDTEIAKKSTDMLACAVSSVLSGKDECMEIKKGIKLTGSATSVSEAGTSIPFSKLEFEMTTETSEEDFIEKCEEECGKKTPPCDCFSCKSEGYKVTCDVVFQAEDANIYCDFNEGYPELEYEEDRPWPRDKRSNVFFVLADGEWKWRSPELVNTNDKFGEKYYN